MSTILNETAQCFKTYVGNTILFIDLAIEDPSYFVQNNAHYLKLFRLTMQALVATITRMEANTKSSETKHIFSNITVALNNDISYVQNQIQTIETTTSSHSMEIIVVDKNNDVVFPSFFPLLVVSMKINGNQFEEFIRNIHENATVEPESKTQGRILDKLSGVINFGSVCKLASTYLEYQTSKNNLKVAELQANKPTSSRFSFEINFNINNAAPATKEEQSEIKRSWFWKSTPK
jgi:hypothetical protein